MPGKNEVVARTFERWFKHEGYRFSPVDKPEYDEAGLVGVALISEVDEKQRETLRNQLGKVVGSFSFLTEQQPPVIVMSDPQLQLTATTHDKQKVSEVYADYNQAQKAVRNFKRRQEIDGRTVVLEAIWPQIEEENEKDQTQVTAEPAPQKVKVPAKTKVAKPAKEKKQPLGTAQQVGDTTVHVVEEDWIKFQEAADIMGVRYQQVFQRAQAHKLVTKQINGKWFASLKSVLDWQKARGEWLERGRKKAPQASEEKPLFDDDQVVSVVGDEE